MAVAQRFYKATGKLTYKGKSIGPRSFRLTLGRIKEATGLCFQDFRSYRPDGTTVAACNSTPAVNLHNENPTLVALGKLTHTNPRATLSLK